MTIQPTSTAEGRSWLTSVRSAGHSGFAAAFGRSRVTVCDSQPECRIMRRTDVNDVERLCAIEEIKQVKARYFRGIDTKDNKLIRSILAEDCVLDYQGCCTDPTSGRDFVPALNLVMRGTASFSSNSKSKIVSVHQGHNCEIIFTSDTSASAIWSMTDRLFMAEGSEPAQITGYGFYHDTYEKIDNSWKIQTMRISRTRVEGI